MSYISEFFSKILLDQGQRLATAVTVGPVPAEAVGLVCAGVARD